LTMRHPVLSAAESRICTRPLFLRLRWTSQSMWNSCSSSCPSDVSPLAGAAIVTAGHHESVGQLSRPPPPPRTSSTCQQSRRPVRQLVRVEQRARLGAVIAQSPSVMSLPRLYLLLLALCAFVVSIQALVALPSEVVALPSEAAPSWAPLPRPEGFQPEFTREQTARA
jgi:hypothetical protein